MNLISDALGSIARLLTRLVLWAAGAVFALSLLVAALVVVVVLTLRALFTGRKPEPVVVWRRWKTATESAARSTRFGARGATADAEVMDVQAREVGLHAHRGAGQADAPARIEHQK